LFPPGSSWLATRVVRELEEVGGLTEALIASVARRHGLSHVGLNALAVIEGNGPPFSAGEVAARAHITSGTFTSVLDTLERNGCVERLTDPDDRRRVLVEITPDAQALLDGHAVSPGSGGLDIPRPGGGLDFCRAVTLKISHRHADGSFRHPAQGSQITDEHSLVPDEAEHVGTHRQRHP